MRNENALGSMSLYLWIFLISSFTFLEGQSKNLSPLQGDDSLNSTQASPYRKIMATEQNQNGDQEVASSSALSWSGRVVKKFQDLKENAEAFPYVWGSYILVYGGFGLYMIYRWRKLRRTEDNVRVLQQRLKDLVESEESAIAAGLLEKETPSSSLSIKKPLSSKATRVENPPHSAPTNVEK